MPLYAMYLHSAPGSTTEEPQLMMVPLLNVGSDYGKMLNIPAVLRYVIKVPPRTRKTFTFNIAIKKGRLCKVRLDMVFVDILVKIYLLISVSYFDLINRQLRVSA